ncbi:hypothetical protein JCM6882_009365 [Rhodosporidiobolus microsporus]
MATAFRPQPTPAAHGSRTMTATCTPAPEAGPSTGGGEAGPSGEGERVVGVLRLRGRGPQGQRVQWTDETVDNEGLGRKKSKICCIYHKPKAFDESSDESSGSDSGADSDSSAGSIDSRSSAAARRRNRRAARHHHHHHDGPCEHGEEGGGEGGSTRRNGGSSTVLEQPQEKPEPNAYERSGGGGGKGKERVVLLLKQRKVLPKPLALVLTLADGIGPTSLSAPSQETIAVVETATGGLIASTILSLPGTSAVFAGGVLAYQLAVRERFLPGWSEGTESYDGPNEQIVFSLARSLSSQLPSTYALAESGVAGPGLSPSYRAEIDAPGYCPLAIVGEGLGEKGVRKTLRVPQRERAGGEEKTRAENMVAFAEGALELFLEVLDKRERGQTP